MKIPIRTIRIIPTGRAIAYGCPPPQILHRPSSSASSPPAKERELAALSAVQLITALLEVLPTLAALGLQIHLTIGTAQMFTGRIHNEMLSAFIAERVPAPRTADRDRA